LTAYCGCVSEKSQVKMNGECNGTEQFHTNIAFTCGCNSLFFSHPVS
jgi:hypothetical protein